MENVLDRIIEEFLSDNGIPSVNKKEEKSTSTVALEMLFNKQ